MRVQSIGAYHRVGTINQCGQSQIYRDKLFLTHQIILVDNLKKSLFSGGRLKKLVTKLKANYRRSQIYPQIRNWIGIY